MFDGKYQIVTEMVIKSGSDSIPDHVVEQFVFLVNFISPRFLGLKKHGEIFQDMAARARDCHFYDGNHY